jgi:ParB-like chromosome segregation protein Spo0J
MRERIRNIRIDRIQPNYRLCYSGEDLETLCLQIESGGRGEPIEVFFDGEFFRILDGEKRWRAHKRLGSTYVKAFIVESHYRSF